MEEHKFCENQKKINFLKVSTTSWLSHDEACKHLVLQFLALVNTLDTPTQESKDFDSQANSTDICNSVLEPNTILKLLLLTNILKHISRFSWFLQTKNFIYAETPSKFKLLSEAIR